MCGIAAIVGYGPGAPQVDERELHGIREAMARRGPDGHGTWIAPDGRIGLAHRRLAIVGPSEAGAQPMATRDGRVRIVFNGEIYNYRSIRQQLEDEFDFFSDSDTEVLLYLYQRYGAGLVHRIRGMYAFALWDETRRGLLVARDPFGIKPLYYADDGRTFRVASQVKALIAGHGVDDRAAAAGHVGFYLFGYVPEPFTLYRAVRAFPAGTVLWITESKQTTTRFFDLRTELMAAEADSHSLSGPGPLREVLHDSVAHHLVADVPIGLFLSAGIDSSSLAHLVSEVQGTPPRTMTLAFGEFLGTKEDEAPLAELVARRLGAQHETRRVTLEDFEAQVENLLEAMDQPSTDGVNTYFVAQIAAEAGLKVAISGLGGDELFGSYPSFIQVPRLVRLVGPFQAIASPVGKHLRGMIGACLPERVSPKYLGLLEYGGSYAQAYLLRRALFMPWELSQFLDRDVVDVGLQELDVARRLSTTIEGLTEPGLIVSALESEWYMRSQLLRDTDWAGMAHSVEVRVPLVDIEVFRRVARWRASARPPGKEVMTRAVARPLPQAVVGRRKSGFAVPMEAWAAARLPPARPAAGSLGRGKRGWAQVVYRSFVSHPRPP